MVLLTLTFKKEEPTQHNQNFFPTYYNMILYYFAYNPKSYVNVEIRDVSKKKINNITFNKESVFFLDV